MNEHFDSRKNTKTLEKRHWNEKIIRNSQFKGTLIQI